MSLLSTPEVGTSISDSRTSSVWEMGTMRDHFLSGSYEAECKSQAGRGMSETGGGAAMWSLAVWKENDKK